MYNMVYNTKYHPRPRGYACPMADHEFTGFQQYYVKCKDSSIWFYKL